MDFDYNTARLIAAQKNSGFWQTENRCFFNKTECLRYASKLKTDKVSFHFYDEVYGSYDWKKEPTESLEELYKERAIQLREKYKHLVLMISGGADSTTMLQSFLKNNIKVDELVCVFPLAAIEKKKHEFDPTDRSAKNYMFEYTHAAYPILKSVSKSHPEIKITVLDYINDSIDMVGNNDFYKLSQSGSLMAVHLAYQYTAQKYVMSLNKDSTLVYAIDKPRIKYHRETKKFVSTFPDFSTVYGHFDYEVFGGSQPKIEYFYYTPDLAKIVIKQSIMIKNYLESISIIDNIDSPLYQGLVTRRKGNILYDINVHHDLIKKTIYKDWNTEIFQAKKSTSIFHTEMQTWFFDQDLVSQRLQDFFEGQMDELLTGVNRNWIIYTPENKPGALTYFSTKFYEL
jgi:hypothetical protein